jgi:hypothetical protein
MRKQVNVRLVPLAALSVFAAAGLVACGGGGGGGGPATMVSEASRAPVAETASSAASTGDTVVGTTATVIETPAPAIAAPAPAAPVAVSAAPKLADCELFPESAIFNTRIDDASRFPAHANSGSWISWIGASTSFRADWWRGEDPTQRTAYYGMPVNVVDGSSSTTDWASMRYDFSTSGLSGEAGWPHESDCAVAEGSGFRMQRGCQSVPDGSRRFPVPTQNVKNEGGTCNDPNTCGDHHLLVVEAGACRLWEGFASYKLGSQWYSLSTAAWDLKSLSLRPDTWTAADAAGLPITPFLVKAEEVAQGEIRHALRVTFRDAVLARSHVWPARHHAGGDTPGGVPFGALLRLKADFVIPDHWNAQAKTIARAAKQYGLYVADIGMDFYVQGEPSVQWEEDTFRQVSGIALSQMEFVDLSAVTNDSRWSADSMAASWR